MSVRFIIKDNIFKKVLKRMRKLGTTNVEVGVFSNEDRGGITMVELAAVHEFGSPKLRP